MPSSTSNPFIDEQQVLAAKREEDATTTTTQAVADTVQREQEALVRT
jgi:hypothetical protein